MLLGSVEAPPRALLDPVTARSALKVPNLEPRAVCRASQPTGPPGRGTVARL